MLWKIQEMSLIDRVTEYGESSVGANKVGQNAVVLASKVAELNPKNLCPGALRYSCGHLLFHQCSGFLPPQSPLHCLLMHSCYSPESEPQDGPIKWSRAEASSPDCLPRRHTSRPENTTPRR